MKNTYTLDDVLARCDDIQRNPYASGDRLPEGICNGHTIRECKSSLAAVVIDGRIVNMGVINYQYPDGHIQFCVKGVNMTGAQYVRYLLTGLLPEEDLCGEDDEPIGLGDDEHEGLHWDATPEEQAEIDAAWRKMQQELDDYAARMADDDDTIPEFHKYGVIDIVTGEEWYTYAETPALAAEHVWAGTNAGTILDVYDADGAVEMYLGGFAHGEGYDEEQPEDTFPADAKLDHTLSIPDTVIDDANIRIIEYWMQTHRDADLTRKFADWLSRELWNYGELPDDHRSHASYAVIRHGYDGLFQTITMDHLEDDTNQYDADRRLLRRVAKLVAHDDIYDITLEELVISGCHLEYVGWQPGMEIAFRNLKTGVVVFDECFPQWDH